MTEISEEIQKIDRQHAEIPSPDLYKKRISLQSDFDLLSTEESAKLLLQSRHRLYEQGEKAGRLLAHQIRRAAASRFIMEINSTSGESLTDQQEINNVFKSFYTTLYTSESKGDHHLIDDFLDKLQIPTIEANHKVILEESFSLTDLMLAQKACRALKLPALMGSPLNF